MERINMFCLNMSNDDTGYECDNLLLRQIDERMKEEQKELHDRLYKNIFGSIRPTAYGIIAGVLILLVSSVLRRIPSLHMLANIAVGIGLLTFAVTLIMVSILHKRNANRRDTVDDEVDRFYDRCARALRVPEKAPEVDIHTLFYEVKDGVRQNYHESGAYLNEVMHVFEEDGKLCLFCSDRVWAVPISSIEEIVRMDEKILFSEWNKETPHNEGKYAQYHIEACENDEYCMNDYYSIRFTHEGTPYELLIPTYDIEPFLSILPLTPVCA